MSVHVWLVDLILVLFYVWRSLTNPRPWAIKFHQSTNRRTVDINFSVARTDQRGMCLIGDKSYLVMSPGLNWAQRPAHTGVETSWIAAGSRLLCRTPQARQRELCDGVPFPMTAGPSLWYSGSDSPHSDTLTWYYDLFCCRSNRSTLGLFFRKIMPGHKRHPSPRVGFVLVTSFSNLPGFQTAFRLSTLGPAGPSPTTIPECRRISPLVGAIWHDILEATIRRLYASIPHQMTACIQDRDGATEYLPASFLHLFLPDDASHWSVIGTISCSLYVK